ncbi:MAG: YitT family protein [Ruminococcaceae bacterium]|nr:YitT family protein [Oscillospiraceae bacterium]
MLKRFLKDYLVISFGSILAGAAIFFFMMPSNVAVGSGSALAMVLSNFIPLPVSVISLLLNIFLLILGFILVGPEFGAKTIYCAILVPVSIGIFEGIFPNFKSLTDDQLIDTICYILVVGIAMAILFSRNASSGGLDIVAKIMNKHLKMEFGKASAVAGIIIALSSIVCYDIKSVIIGILGTYFGGLLVDYFIFGLNIKRRVCIISPKLDEIVDFILNELHSGATLNEIIGAYDKTTRQEVITIVDKQEFRRLMDYVRKTDPKAFVTVYSVSEIRYQPKVQK